MTLCIYEVNVRGQRWAKEILHVSAAKAKYVYLLEVQDAWQHIGFKDLECRSLGRVQQNAEFHDVARRRQVPHAQLGMRIQMESDSGVIVGSNSADNFQVLFTSGAHKGKILPCHPTWMTRYFDKSGNVLGDFFPSPYDRTTT